MTETVHIQGVWTLSGGSLPLGEVGNGSRLYTVCAVSNFELLRWFWDANRADEHDSCEFQLYLGAIAFQVLGHGMARVCCWLG